MTNPFQSWILLINGTRRVPHPKYKITFIFQKRSLWGKKKKLTNTG